MERYLSKTKIESFAGNVIPLRLCGGEEYGNEEIQWECTSDCIGLRSFEGDENGSFTDGVLITLLSEGEGVVTATLDGVVYRCEILVRPMKKGTSKKGLSYYIGDFHDHTQKDHSKDGFASRHQGTPFDYLSQVRNEGILDFSVVSDHADLLNPKEYFRGFWDADQIPEKDLVCFAGCEAEVSPIEADRFGIMHKNAGEIVTINGDLFASVFTWDQFFKRYETSPFAISVLAHPQVCGHSTKGIWNFCLDRNRSPRFREMVKGVEMGNGTTKSSNLINEYVYSTALDQGFRVSTTCSSDCHGPVWGFTACPGKTVIMAEEKSKEAFMDAIFHQRMYATESGNVKLYYEVNGQSAPSDLPLENEYRFHVEIARFRDEEDTFPILLQVISDGGECLFETETVTEVMDFSVSSQTAHYFYLRLTDPLGRRTWSPPVWTGRTWEETVLPTVVPLENKGFALSDEVSGQDASLLMNGNPEAFWRSEKSTCSILIDLKEEQTVCALGHYPMPVYRSDIKERGEKLTDVIASLPVSYEIYGGNDPDAMNLLKKGMLRIFGEETMLRFPETKLRYLRFHVLSTAGKESRRAECSDSCVAMGEITLFKKA